MQKKNVRMTPQVRAYVTDRTEWLIRRSTRAPDDSARDDGMGLMKRVRRAWQQRACMPHGSSSSHGPLIIAMHRKMPTTTLQSSLSSCWLVSAPTAPCTHPGGFRHATRPRAEHSVVRGRSNTHISARGRKGDRRFTSRQATNDAPAHA
jgi:hypothetical protein